MRSRVLRLHLVEQPHILDRDQSLIRKRADKLDLAIREAAGFRFRERKYTLDLALSDQGNTQRRPKLPDLGRLDECVLGIGEHVRQVHQFAGQKRAPDKLSSISCNRMSPQELGKRF